MGIGKLIGLGIATAVLAASVGCASIDAPVSEPVEDPLVNCDCIANDGLFFYLEGNRKGNLEYLQSSLGLFECARDCYNNEDVFTYDDTIENYWMNIVQGDINFLEGDYDEALDFYLLAFDNSMNKEIIRKLNGVQALRSRVQVEPKAPTFDTIKGLYKPTNEEQPVEDYQWGSIKAMYR